MNTELKYENFLEIGHHLPEPQPDNSAKIAKTQDFLTLVRHNMNQNEVNFGQKYMKLDS